MKNIDSPQTELKALQQRVTDLEKQIRKHHKTEEELTAANQQLQENEARIQHLNKVRLAIRNINQLVSLETNRDRLVKGTCDCLTANRGYYNAWIMLLDKQGHFESVFESGLGKKFIPMRKLLSQNKFTDCAVRALNQPEMVVIENPKKACTNCPLVKYYEDRGAMTVRIEHEEQILGLLTVSTPSHFIAQDDERKLLQEVANDLGLALHNIIAGEMVHRLTKVVNTLPQPVSLISREYRYLAVNNIYAEFYHTSTEQIIGRKVEDFLGKDIFNNEIKPQLDACLSGEEIRYEVKIDFKSKGKRWMAMEYYPYYDAKGNIFGVISHGLDITDQKNLKEERDKFFDISLDLICIAGMDGYFKYVSPSWRKILGYSEQELLSKPFLDFIHPEDHQKNNREVARLADGKETFDFINRYLHKNGSILTIEWTATSDPEKGIIYCIGRDITDRRKAAAELQAVNQQLAANEQQLLAANQQLAATEQQLRANNEALNEKSLALEEQLQKSEKQRIANLVVLGDLNKTTKQLKAEIEERKKVENQLKDRQKELEQIFKAMPDALVYADNERRIKRVNPAFERIFGYKPEEVIGKKSRIIYAHPEDFTKQGEQRYNIHARDLFESYEIEYKRKNGEIFPSETVGTPVRDTQDQSIGLLGLVRDITERKRAEILLRQERDLSNRIINDSPLGILIFDVHGVIKLANRQAEEIFGLNESEILGKKYNEPDLEITTVDGASFPEDQLPFHRTMLTREAVYNVEYAIHRPDGKRRIISLNTAPLCNTQGEIERVVCTINDITEQRSLQAQLNQAQKLESIGKLAGGIAHDFNNMLGVIIGNAEFALETLTDDCSVSLREDIKEILNAAHRSADLTRQLLAFARKQTVTLRVIDLNETVEGTLKMLRRLIGEDIELIWLPGKNLEPIKMDPAQIDQMLANLCVNARDAIGPNVGRISIETGLASFDEAYCADHADFVPGDYVMLVISDNGCGMEKEIANKIFEPFFTTKELGKGTGLGLATVYGIVKQNRGFINVYSEPAHGTRFTIYLPRYVEKTTRVRNKIDAGKNVEGGKETILLVEDEPAILKMTTQMLEQQGYTVLPAARPAEAMHLAEVHPGRIDLLMTDVVMPEMNGRDLARSLLSLYPNVKRLFMSGYTGDVIALHGVLDPGVHFIQKPFSIKRLTAKVREALEDKSQMTD